MSVRRLSVALSAAALALVGLPAGANALKLFEDPARIVVLSASPVDFLVDDAGPGPDRLLVLDIERRVYEFSLDGDWPHTPERVIDVDGTSRYGDSGAELRLVDMNNDGYRDLVTLGQETYVALARPDGSFEGALAWLAPGFSGLTLADVDADGALDLVTEGNGRWLFTIRRGLGDGRFEPTRGFGVGTLPAFTNRLGILDLDADGDLDALTQESGSPVVDSWMSDGANLFVRRPVLELDRARHRVSVVGLARLNDDDRPDLILKWLSDRYMIPDTLVVHLQQPDGTFGPAAAPLVGEPGGYSAHFQDMNGDGRDDWVEHHDELFVRYTGPDGTLGERQALGRTGGDGAILAHDFDRDGRLDLLAASHRSMRLFTAGELAMTTANPAPYLPDGYDEPRLIDVNGDGRLDLLGVAYDDEIGVFVARGLEGGGFAEIDSSYIGEDDWYDGPLEPGDLDGDGDIDLISTARGDRRLVTELVNDGTGRFTRRWIDLSGAIYPPMIIADFDGDRVDEILVQFDEPDYPLSILRIKEDGSTDRHHTIVPPRPAYNKGVFDLDGDGRLDIWTFSGGYNAEFTRWIQQASGEFVAGAPEALPVSPGRLHFGDWLGDSRPDIVAVDYGELFLLTQDALGEWVVVRRVDGLTEVQPIADPDLNGDGHPDLLLTSDTYDYPYQVVLTEPGRGFSDPFPINVGFRPYWLTIGDLDGDGQPDLVGGAAYETLFIRRGLPQPSVTVSDWRLSSDGWQVTCRWQLDSEIAGTLRVRRESLPAGFQPEEAVGEAPATQGAGVLVDDAVPRAGRYRYRLVMVDGEGDERTLASAAIEVVPPALAMRLGRVEASPGPGPFTLHYESSVVADAVLEVFDAAGRRVSAAPVPVEATRFGTIRWRARGDDGRPVAGGVYFARLAGSESVARIVIVR